MGLNSTPLRIPRSQPHFLSNTIKGSKEGAKARHVIVKNEESSKSETELERLGILTQGSATSPIELEFFPSRAGVIVLKQVKDSIKDVEIQRLKKLDHQNIVKFIDLVSLHDLRYLRLELKTYLTTLDEYIQSTQPISENELGVLISHVRRVA
jgi:hypothetical protein